MPVNPYAAPKSEEITPPVIPAESVFVSPYGPYRDVTKLKWIVMGLLALGVFLSCTQIYALVLLNQANVIPDDDPSQTSRIESAWELSDQVADAETTCFIITVIFWCFWKSRSCKNAWVFTYRLQGREAIVSHHPTPAWAVGSYFIPILHLYKPFQAMAFIRDSCSVHAKGTGLLALWWLTWLIGSSAGTIFLYLSGNGHIIEDEELPEDELIMYNESLMMDAGSGIISTLTAAIVIYQLSKAQKHRAHELK